MGVHADAASPAAPGGGEVRWAKGIQSGARKHLWSMAFQIRGKRHALALRCSQAEAAVAYDLAGFWSHRAKGNNPRACTRYNFPLAWYPRRLLEEFGALPDWEAVKGRLAELATAGTLRQLIPFEGAGRRYSVADAASWRPHQAAQLCINARGVHFYRGSWVCVPMADVESFGSVGGLLNLTYVLPDGRPRRPDATSATFRCPEAGQAYCELQAAAAGLRAAGLHAPRDAGAAVPLPLGGRGRAAGRPLAWGAGNSEEEEEEGEEEQEEQAAMLDLDCQRGGALHAVVDDDDACNPSPEELELLADFADLAARGSADLSSHSAAAAAAGSGSGASNSGGGAPSAEQHQQQQQQQQQDGQQRQEQQEEQQQEPSGAGSGTGGGVKQEAEHASPVGGASVSAGVQAAEASANLGPALGTAAAAPRAEPQAAAAAAAADGSTHGPTGSSSSSRAGGKPAVPGTAVAGPRGSSGGGGEAGSLRGKQRLEEEGGVEGAQEQRAAAVAVLGEVHPPVRKKRRRRRADSPLEAQQLSAQQQQLLLAAQRQHQAQMMQLMGMGVGMPQLVPLAAMPPAVAAAMRQQQAAGMLQVPCFPFAHPGMACMVPMMAAPVVLTPAMAAAMQAHAAAAAAAARQAQAAAADPAGAGAAGAPASVSPAAA